MATGTTKYGSDLLRVPSLHADGGRHSIAFTVTLLEDDAGNVAGLAAVVRDETERWNEEQELRRLAGCGGTRRRGDGTGPRRLIPPLCRRRTVRRAAAPRR